MSDVRNRMESVFREVFDDPALVLRDDMTANDVEGWDSLTHINLIIAIERALAIKFATAEIARLKASDQNVGSFLRLVESKICKI
jgi:acyl carrier protein